MVWRIFGGLTFIIIGLTAFGVAIPTVVLGVCAIVAGIAVLAPLP